MPLFITAVIRKSDAPSDKDVSFYAEDQQDNEGTKKEDGATVDLTDDYLRVGTYCSVLYNESNPRKITLKGIHRVDVSKLTGHDLKEMFVELQKETEEPPTQDKQSSIKKILDSIESDEPEEDHIQELE